LIKADERRQPWFQRQFERISEGAYAQTLSLALKRPVVTGLLAVGLLAGSLALFPFVGVSLFPKAETQQFMIEVELPDGSALHETDRVVRYVEGVLGAHEGVEGYASNIGRGNPRVYYNVVPEAEKSAYAQIYVDVVSERWQDRQQVADDLRATFAETGPAGATVRVEEFMQGPPLEAPVVIKVLGEELETLGEISDDVAAMLQRTEGTTNIDNPLGTSAPTLRVDVNREKAGRLGVPLVEIDRTVRASIAGLPVTTYRTAAGDERSVVLRLPTEGDRAQLSDLDRVRVSSITGAQVPLSTLAETRFEAGPSKINHVDLERGVSVTSDVLDGYTATAVAASLVEQLDAYPWPAGYRYAIGGELEQTQESFGGLLQALLVALFGIFGVLVLQFRSFRQPLIVFAAIPLAIVGAVLALFITGYTFSFTAGVGLTSLVGIVINNAIILIDYANQLRAEGRSVVDAVTESAQARFTPIVLTTLTTIGGLLPLTLTGSSLWSPFGWA
ncbi:MAG: efflux RND transporter permease subunit, partial [Bacteroidota bacterium]